MGGRGSRGGGRKGRGGGQVCGSRPTSGRVSLASSRGGAAAGNEPLPPPPPRGPAGPQRPRAGRGARGSGGRGGEQPFPRSLPPVNFSLSPISFSCPGSPPPPLLPPAQVGVSNFHCIPGCLLLNTQGVEPGFWGCFSAGWGGGAGRDYFFVSQRCSWKKGL